MRAGEESIELLGHVDTFTLDLEARWQAESGERRLDIPDGDVAFGVEATLAAEPSDSASTAGPVSAGDTQNNTLKPTSHRRAAALGSE